MTTTILPHNRTPWEAAVEGAMATAFPAPAELVASVWNPDTCPADLLPYLAWGLSVDLWDDRWAETTKREACRKSLILHRLKTTPAGIRAHVAQVGAEVLRIVRPPARESLRGAMTEDQRRDWLATLPQIRIYPLYKKAIAKSRGFLNGPAGMQFVGVWQPDIDLGVTDEDGNEIGGYSTGAVSDDGPVAPFTFLRTSRGFNLYGRKATFYDRNFEVDVTLGSTDFGDVDRVMLRRKAPNRNFFGHGFVNGYLRTSVAETNVVTVQFGRDQQGFAVSPSMDPVNVRPERIAKTRIAPACNSFFGRTKRHLRESFGPLMIYDRIALLDPSRLGARRKVLAFHGHGRFGIDPYTAEIRMRVPMRRPRLRSGRWHGNGYTKAPDMAPLARAIEAVRVSKAFRDTVLIDTATIGQVKFGSGLRFGEFAFGQMKEVQ